LQAEKDLNLDKPVPVRYVLWLKKAATLDFGFSASSNQKVTTIMRVRVPGTLAMMFYAQLLALLLAVPLALIAAYRRDGIFDRIANAFAFGFLSVPNYIMALFLAVLFAVKWKIFPALSKNISITENPVKHFKSYFLPSISLAFPLMGTYFRLLRTDLITTLQSDFITTARAKGMSTVRIMTRHALRPSLFSLVTAAAINTGGLIGGAILVESIFGFPGMGQLLFVAQAQRDAPVVMLIVAFLATVYVLASFFVDIVYGWLDPRIRQMRALR
jgi:peptide/nickel transport system permease protein